jgi:uncharacterized membrane protein
MVKRTILQGKGGDLYMADEQTISQAPAAAPAAASNSDVEKNKGIAAATYIIFFLPYIAAKDSKFAMFHANQSLVLLIVAVAGNIVLPLIPILGWILWPFFGLAVFVLWIIGVVNALNGKTKELPLIGSIKILPQ